MPTNWPPALNPALTYFNDRSWSKLADAIVDLQAAGWTQRAPTTAERNLYFRDARCDHGHQVIGRMLISPTGDIYPFAVCNDGNHRAALVLWFPYDNGALSD